VGACHKGVVLPFFQPPAKFSVSSRAAPVVLISSDSSRRLAATWHVALSRVQSRVQELSFATLLLGADCACLVLCAWLLQGGCTPGGAEQATANANQGAT
jgi:hypothetical protein